MTAESNALSATPNIEEFRKDAVPFMLGAYDIDTFAAMHRMSVDAATALIETHAGVISQAVAQAVAEGRDVPAIAKRTLVEVLRNLDEQVRNSNLPPGTLLKAAETLNKISGLEAKQRMPLEQTDRVIFNIHLGGDTGDGKIITVDSHPVGDDSDETPGFMRTLAEAGENLRADGGEYE